MASAAVLWFGKTMSAVPLRNNKAAASAVPHGGPSSEPPGRSATATMDLLRASPGRYRIEGFDRPTAMSGILAKLAKEFDARFVAIADPSLLEDLEDALAGSGTECGAGESAVIEAAARPAELGHGRRKRRRRV